MFFWNSLPFSAIQYVGNLIFGSSAFSKTSLNIWKFTVHILLKSGLENFESFENLYILQEYIEELYKKDLDDQDNHNGMITHLETDIWNVKLSGP